MTDLATQGSDDLRASLESAFDSDASSSASTTSTAPDTSLDDATMRSDGTVETAAQKAERARDDAGRFAKAQEKAEGKTGDTPAPEAKPVKKLPNSWKREVAAVWEKVDKGETLTAAEVDLMRDEAIRREGDFHTGIEKYKSSAEAAHKFKQAYRPYEATIRQLGVTPDVAAAHLFAADHKLRHSDPASKAQMVAELINQYGVDPNQVWPHFQPKQEIDPALKPVYDQMQELARKNQELEQRWQSQQQGSQERELANFSNEIAKFSQTEGKEHFTAVFDDMVALLPLVRQSLPNANTQEVLKDAYDRAIWARPDLRANLLEQQAKAAQDKARAEFQSQRAKTAAVSVKGSSPVAGAASSANASVRDAILAAAQEHNF